MTVPTYAVSEKFLSTDEFTSEGNSSYLIFLFKVLTLMSFEFLINEFECLFFSNFLISFSPTDAEEAIEIFFGIRFNRKKNARERRNKKISK